MRTTDNINPDPITKIEEFNVWLNWMQTKLLFKHPGAKKIFVNSMGHESEAEALALRLAGEYYDLDNEERYGY